MDANISEKNNNKKDEKTSTKTENKRINQKPDERSSFLLKYINLQTLITFFVLYLIFIGIPWFIENKEKFFGKNDEIIIKVPVENFGVEPNQILRPYGLDLIPTDKNKVVNIKTAACLYGWSNFVLKEEEKKEEKQSNEIEKNKEVKSSDSTPSKEFIPIFPIPLDSPRRLFCPAVKLPDKPGEYSFTILVETYKGKYEKTVKFYVTKPLGELLG